MLREKIASLGAKSKTGLIGGIAIAVMAIVAVIDANTADSIRGAICPAAEAPAPVEAPAAE